MFTNLNIWDRKKCGYIIWINHQLQVMGLACKVLPEKVGWNRLVLLHCVAAVFVVVVHAVVVVFCFQLVVSATA